MASVRPEIFSRDIVLVRDVKLHAVYNEQRHVLPV